MRIAPSVLFASLVLACAEPSSSSEPGPAADGATDTSPAVADAEPQPASDLPGPEDVPEPADEGPLGDPGAPDQGTEDATDADTPAQPKRERSCSTLFRYVPEPGAGAPETVQLSGAWDGWAVEDMESTGGEWVAWRDLEPGTHCYKLLVDGEWVLDPQNHYQAYCAGVKNSGMRVPDCTRPLVTLDGNPTKDQDGLGAKVLFWAGHGGAGPGEVGATLRHDFEDAEVATTWNADTWELSFELSGLEPGKYTVRVEASDAEGKVADPLLLPFWVEEEPFEWRDALIYMVMTDRHRNGNEDNDPGPTPDAHPSSDWMGGDFAGLTATLTAGYLDELGVRAIWLTPFNTGAVGVPDDPLDEHGVTSYHGYWPVEARTVDPRLGTAEELETLVAAAHERGIRILMDFVANHTHVDHEYVKEHPEWFNDGCKCGTEGCDWTDEALTCLFASYMPDIDWRNQEASEQMIADALWWIETFDLDGARVDAVKHLHDLAVFNFATRVGETFESAGTDYYLVGETAMGWAGDEIDENEKEWQTINDYLGPGGLDGQFDFVLFHAVAEKVFLRSEKGYIHLDVWTGLSQEKYVAGSVMAPYIGSHDTSRVASVADYRGQDEDHPTQTAYNKWPEDGLPEAPSDDEPYERVRSAHCWLLTVPGAPMIYQGDEYGQWGGGDPDNRHMFRTGEELTEAEKGLLEATRALGKARRELEPLRRGAYETLGATETTLPFLRRTEDGQMALVVLNGGENPASVTVDLTGLCVADSCWKEKLGLGAALVVVGGEAQITVPPRSCGVFAP